MNCLLRSPVAVIVAAGALVVNTPAVVFAQGSVEPAKVKAAANPEVVTLDEEATALDFAAKHHPELAKLLGAIKQSRPKEYTKGVRELFRASDRLTRMQSRQPGRAEIELELWKTESRLRLVAARTAMVDDDERREQVESLVRERNALKIKLAEFEKAEAKSRIAQLEKQIELLQAQQNDGVRKEVDRLVNTAKSSADRVKTKPSKAAEDSKASEKAKPAAKRPAGSSGEAKSF